MSKIKLLLEVVNDLRSLADSVQAVADAMVQSETASESVPAELPKSSAPKEKPITLEQVRSVLAEKSHDGQTDAVRELLQKYGASTLSAVDPKHYKALLADAEALTGTPKGPTDLLGRGGAAK